MTVKLKECKRCHLHETRTHVVPGKGNPKSDVIFIGEAPGREENKAGIPFIGRSGQELSKFITGLGVKEKDLYITNSVKCWPCTKDGKNRTPDDEELTVCSPWLDIEIKRSNPWMIITLGATALKRITGIGTFGKRRGKLEWSMAYDCYVFIMYHPSYIIRGNPNALVAWKADQKRLKEMLGWDKEEREYMLDLYRKDEPW